MGGRNPCLCVLLILAIWMVGFTRVWADGTSCNQELSGLEKMHDPSLCPMAAANGIAIEKLSPEKCLNRTAGVHREFLVWNEEKPSRMLKKSPGDLLRTKHK